MDRRLLLAAAALRAVATSPVTDLVRLAAWAIGPLVAGLAMAHASLAAPLLLGAGVKIVYDLLLFAAFRNLRPSEERAALRRRIEAGT